MPTYIKAGFTQEIKVWEKWTIYMLGLGEN
jgi:uncharacterized membrane protein